MFRHGRNKGVFELTARAYYHDWGATTSVRLQEALFN